MKAPSQDNGRCRIESGVLHCPPSAHGVVTSKNMRNKRRLAPIKSRVKVVRDTNTERAIEQAVDGVGGMCHYVKPNDLVVVKPNIMGGNHNEPSTFTNPRVTKKVVEMVEACGGDPVVVDSSMIWTKFAPVVEKTGYKRWAQENGVRLHNLEDLPRRKADFGQYSTIKKTDVSKLLLDADVLINVPVAKTHLYSSITVGMKNLYGLLPSVDKAKYHARGINDVIVDVTRFMTPNLTIIDNTRGCEGYGPLWCEAVKPNYDMIIASNDVVCADAKIAELIGYKIEEVPALLRAHREHLGDTKCTANAVAPHPKDGNWKRPHTNTVKFTDEMTKFITMFPNVVSWFNANADFYLGDLAFNKFTNEYVMRPLWGLLDSFMGNALYKQDAWYVKLLNMNPFASYHVHEEIPQHPYDALREDDVPLKKGESKSIW